MAVHLDLLPPFISRGGGEDFVKARHNLLLSVSPRDNSIGVFAGTVRSSHYAVNGVAPTQGKVRDILFASADKMPSAERRLFITDTSVIFAAFQNLISVTNEKGSEALFNVENLRLMNKLVNDYVNFAKECWVHASQAVARPDGLQYTADHYRSIYTCTSLFQTLYLPDPDVEHAPVGDELMEWLNTHFIEPSTEEGDVLSRLESAWEGEGFWEYLTRTALRGLTKATVFFLKLLSSSHPSSYLQSLSDSLIPILEDQPHLQQFKTEREFTLAHHRWKNQVKALRVELHHVPEDEETRFDGWDNWWDRLSDIVAVLEGREDVLMRVVQDLGGGWKEVCAAWGVFVDPRLRRQELPEVVERVIDVIPYDPTDLEDIIHAQLLTGEVAKALVSAEKLDVWLSCHLADVMNALGLLQEAEEGEEVVDGTGTTLRQHHVLQYAEYLHSDPALWRITVDYMCACGEIGTYRADEVLLRVPLGFSSYSQPTGSDPGGKKTTVNDDRIADTEDEASRIRAGDIVGVLKEVNQCCFEHGREGVRRMVCRIAGKALMSEKQYGLAISYYTSAEDWPGLGRVIDQVLNEYITQGPAKFTSLVAEIAPSLQTLRSAADSSDYPMHGIFLHRLMFIVKYAEFHQRKISNDLIEAAADLMSMFEGDIAPTSWWGVLLQDSVEFLNHPGGMLFTSANIGLLLRKMEEVQTRTSQGSGEDYLSVLVKIIRSSGGKGIGGEKEALNKLKMVRLALAKYFARCGVIGVGGKDSLNAVTRNSNVYAS
ncbi:hypothetical protein BDM02DRAFT_3105390 [Thelephora ganbajun]|uniref:Uncharacterized protein n=1 Tax=Thelephora ganbajun TaxID=370292 RepID=A0ACB6Z038_THEGA|nr:hypothetical protein BDM02DRAFT_3105390 [Thelephora ganbajun]